MSTATFTCGTCGVPFTVDERFRGQTVQCQACKALCELPRLDATLVSAPKLSSRREDSRTESLLLRIAEEQHETNRQLWWIHFWVSGIIVLIAVCGGLGSCRSAPPSF